MFINNCRLILRILLILLLYIIYNPKRNVFVKNVAEATSDSNGGTNNPRRRGSSGLTTGCCHPVHLDCTPLGKDLGVYCLDCTEPRMGLRPRCGVDRCNLIGCNCRGGCRPLVLGAEKVYPGVSILSTSNKYK